MVRKDFDHSKIVGVDESIETSLCKHGFAWIESKNETLFYYGIKYNDQKYERFDMCSFNSELDVKEEFDWIDCWNGIFEYVGMEEKEWMEMDLPNQIKDLFYYFGYENIFGSSLWEGFTYEEIGVIEGSERDDPNFDDSSECDAPK